MLGCKIENGVTFTYISCKNLHFIGIKPDNIGFKAVNMPDKICPYSENTDKIFENAIFICKKDLKFWIFADSELLTTDKIINTSILIGRQYHSSDNYLLIANIARADYCYRQYYAISFPLARRHFQRMDNFLVISSK